MTGERLLIVTGMSGAGRSTCLKMLEDQGFEAFDNLPLPLMERLLHPEEGFGGDLAIGIDSRTRAFDPLRLIAFVERMKATRPFSTGLVFFECDDEVLQQRFTETRRRHPLATDRPVADGIARERALMAPLRDAADCLIDTSRTTLPDLRRRLGGLFDPGRQGRLTVSVLSFAYRQGLPREADLVFDARFLRNPHYVDELRPLTGLDPKVQQHIAADPDFTRFAEGVRDLLLPLLPRYLQEGKSYLTIAFGCTGGRHRSVFLAEWLALRLRREGWEAAATHRELGPAAARGTAA
ncbi:MAG: RNase adapter RapZ [Geminicoccaceae bacterium]|nr:RNase adapter RapZ [Geminicoccaceae bacterium]